jgi:hypothetical protein
MLSCCGLPSWAQIHLSGVLSGTLDPGFYLVDSTIIVNAGDSLTILPPAHFSFTAWYPFKVLGTLTALGTESDSIIFDCDPLTNPQKWHGLRFTGSGASSSRLSYCRISLGSASTYWPENSGGGIFCMNAAPTFEHCLISANAASMYGAGVYCYNAPAVFRGCTIANNSCTTQGGGMYASLSALTLEDCRFLYNSSGGGNGGGLLGISSAMNISNSVFSHNTASVTGGIYLSGDPAATLANCLIEFNSSTGS